ncbi:RNA methyltransferase [Chloroflexales bacterium ZM16-3]|nr:RNA methyltransferase [Chloroflexales bacterium ZM16-3]
MISSASNTYVKYLRSLRADPRDRRSERSFVIEGVRLVAEALAAGADLRVALYNPDQLRGTLAGEALLDQLADRPGCYEAGEVAVSAAADTRSPQGVVAAVAWPEIAPRPGLRLVLDAIQDPGNLGTLLRSAEAAGVGSVLCSQGCADIYSPKVARAAMGAHFSLPLRNDLSWDELVMELLDAPLIYAASAEAAMPYYAADWRQPAALIIGSEAHGVSPEGLGMATHHIAIPMLGRADSLNAGVAGSIIMFEALRQRSRGRT